MDPTLRFHRQSLAETDRRVIIFPVPHVWSVAVTHSSALTECFMQVCDLYIYTCKCADVFAPVCGRTCVWIPQVRTQGSFLRSNRVGSLIACNMGFTDLTELADHQAPAIPLSPQCWGGIRMLPWLAFKKCVCVGNQNAHAFVACIYWDISSALYRCPHVCMPCSLPWLQAWEGWVLTCT